MTQLEPLIVRSSGPKRKARTHFLPNATAFVFGATAVNAGSVVSYTVYWVVGNVDTVKAKIRELYLLHH
jgi:hypothetical protein